MNLPKLSMILEFPPPKPKTGWRVWRDVGTMNWKAEIYIDGKLRREEAAETPKIMLWKMNRMLDDILEDEIEKIELAEIFNEAVS
jgi:hypothetical protein